MKYLTRILILILSFNYFYAHGQWHTTNSEINTISSISISEEFPKISQDSTDQEITTHLEATIKWMRAEFYNFNYAPPLMYSETALSLANRVDNKRLLNRLRSAIGNIMLRVKDTAHAKILFLKSLEEAKKDKDSVILLASLNNLANTYYTTKKYKNKAILNYLEGLTIAEKLKDTARIYIAHHNLSRIYIEDRNIEKTRHHVNQSFKYLNYIDESQYKKSSCLRNKGMLYVLLNKPDEAIKYFKENLKIAKEINHMDGIIDGHKGYIEALELKKDYKNIYKISKTLRHYEEIERDKEAQIIIDAITAKLNSQRFKDQIKSKELEKEILKQTSERKNFYITTILGIVLFLILTLLIIYSAYNKRKYLITNLREKNKQYLLAKEQSEKLTKVKNKFFATISHELRTPLYGVIGLTSILMENNSLKNHEKDFKSLKFSANYLLALVNDLLQFNKIENDSFTTEETNFNIRERINTIVSSFEYIRLQHNNIITVSIANELPELLKGNAIRLSQILMNLISNACKFTENGTITISVNFVKQKGQELILEFIVKDTGPGIEKSKLACIFDEFTQINTVTNTYEGTGLGLSIVKKLVEQSGNSIQVESQLGEGTSFKFLLPLNLVSKKEIDAEQTPIVNMDALKNKHVLIVEDNRINQVVTKKILQKEEVTCDIAQNGEEAVQFVKNNNNYDLILMDINMPIKNGIEASKEIRLFNQSVPIIALTAVEIEEQKVLIFKSGMNDIILKPYDIDVFKTIIIKNLPNEGIKSI